MSITLSWAIGISKEDKRMDRHWVVVIEGNNKNTYFKSLKLKVQRGKAVCGCSVGK